MANETFTPKEIKVLSDILALVLEEQEGQSAAALNALRARAKRNGITGGALKNLFAAIAPDLPQRTTSRTHRKTQETNADLLAAKQQIVKLTENLGQLDLTLRQSHFRVEELSAELIHMQRLRNDLLVRIDSLQHRTNYFYLLVVCGFAAGLLMGIAGTQFVHSLYATPPIDRSIFLR